MRALLKDRRIKVELTHDACEWLAQAGYDPVYGARPLRYDDISLAFKQEDVRKAIQGTLNLFYILLLKHNCVCVLVTTGASCTSTFSTPCRG